MSGTFVGMPAFPVAAHEAVHDSTLRGNLRHLLSNGRPRVHEPAYDPDPDHYVSWEYARGYADGVHDTLAEGTDDPHS